jgi:hypothetical protein
MEVELKKLAAETSAGVLSVGLVGQEPIILMHSTSSGSPLGLELAGVTQLQTIMPPAELILYEWIGNSPRTPYCQSSNQGDRSAIVDPKKPLVARNSGVARGYKAVSVGRVWI